MRFAPRRLLLLAFTVAALAGCGPKAANGESDNLGGSLPYGGEAAPHGKYAQPSDMALGKVDAPATLIEYASLTCSHCAEFHGKIWPGLKANYIDQGKLRFIFREFPTAPPEVALAGFQVARCGKAKPEQYFSRLDALFDQQSDIFTALQNGKVRDTLLTIAKSAGLSEQQFDSCVRDPGGIKRVQETVAAAEKDYKIEGTPTVILNGEKLTAPDAYTYEGLAKLIDAKIAGK